MKLFGSKLHQNIFLLFVLLFSYDALGGDTHLTPVTLKLKWKHQFQFAGYYAAIEKGYYKELGLEVKLIEANNREVPANSVFEGEADFGIAASDVVLMRAEGKSAVILATVFQHSAQILLATESSGIKYAHSLVGKRVMIEPHAADLIAYFNDEGVSLNQLKVIPHSYDVSLLIENKIDAMTAYSTDEPFVLNKNNIAYNIITPITGGIDFYGDVLITTEKLLNDNPILAERFREASLKGWDYAMNHTDEIINLIYAKYSQRHSKAHLAFEAEQMQKLIQPDVIEIGYSNKGRWQRIIDIYKQTKTLNKNVNIKGLLYTDYIKKDIAIPWKIIGVFSFVLLFFGLIILFFYRLSIKLKFEIELNKRINQDLLKSKEDLLVLNEKMIRLSQFKEDMTNMIVHDLKTPLSAIINIELFSNERNWKDIVKQSGHQMNNLIQNILDVYKYENSEFKLNKQKNLLNEIIDKSLSEINFFVEEKLIRFERNENRKCFVNVDKEILLRIFINILSNAIKFSPRNGKIKIYIKADENNITQVIIANEGPAIPKDKQQDIFKKFGQAEKKGHGKLTSTGLGLAFCKMAVEAHGGEIGVISDEGMDVQFWFTLPDTTYIGNSSTKPDFIDKPRIELSDSDKEYLKPIAVKLKDYNVYQISSINGLISTIDAKNKAIVNWVNELEKIVYLGDSETYQSFLNL